MVQKKNIPNLLTYGRVAAVPLALLIILLAPNMHGLLFLLFFAAAVTDFFDGYLARKWNAVSPIGALLDPIADKLLVALLLLHLMVGYGLSILPVACIILREIYISGLREFLANKQITLPVSKGGKLKTSLQLSGIGLMLLANWLYMPKAAWLGEKVIWLAAIIALATAIDYTKSAWKDLK